MKKRNILFLIPFTFFLALAVIAGLSLTLSKKEQQRSSSALAWQAITATQNIVQNEFPEHTQYIAVNFFASWCPPCEVEHPYISELSEHMPVIGVNYKDQPQNRDRFLERLGNPYHTLLNDKDGLIGIDWGVKGVPTTIIIDQKHNKAYRHHAPITPKDISMLLEEIK